MNVMVKVTVPNEVYEFYSGASAQVAEHSVEDIMADALTAYIKILSGENKCRESTP